MTALPPFGTPTADLDPLSEQYEAGRERLGIEPGLGATTAFVYAWRDREKLLDINELVSGVRKHTSFIRVGGLLADVPDPFYEMVGAVIKTFPKLIDEHELLITKNPIWRQRTIGLGKLTPEDAMSYGATGPVLRGSGVPYDLRKAQPYSSYDHFDFDVPIGRTGDVYDRYLVRMQEMRESLKIITQAFENLPDGPVNTTDRRVALPPRNELNTSMESLIHHFKLVTEGMRVPVGQVYQAVESPRGELGFYLVSDGTNRPYRCKVRAPSFSNLSALPHMVRGELIADVVAVIGSIAIVLGDVDR